MHLARATAEQTVRAVAGQQLVPELLDQRQIAGEHVGRQKSFEEVVVPAVAVTPREAEHARDGVRLEDLAAFVESVAPTGLVIGDARVQHEVVAPTGDRQGVELDRAEPAEDLEHGLGASLEGSRRREEVPGDEKTARGFGGDPHAEDASYADVDSVAGG